LLRQKDEDAARFAWQTEGFSDRPWGDGNVGLLHGLLPWTATLNDVGTVAAFVASDQAGTITVAGINISAGAIVD